MRTAPNAELTSMSPAKRPMKLQLRLRVLLKRYLLHRKVLEMPLRLRALLLPRKLLALQNLQQTNVAMSDGIQRAF